MGLALAAKRREGGEKKRRPKQSKKVALVRVI